MKRPPSRPSGFLTQKKIRSYLESPKGSVTPLKDVIEIEEDEPLLTAGLRFAMSSAVKYQLDLFKMTQPRPLECALNKEHIEECYAVSYHIRFFDDLCNAFLKMFSSYRRPIAFSEETGEFLATDDVFHRKWVDFHQKRATLRILCQTCHLSQQRSTTPLQYRVNDVVSTQQPPTKVKSINDILKPYKGDARVYEHPWLDLSSWGERTHKGNYSRLLADKAFTLFMKDAQWHYVYDGQFSKQGYHCLKDILQATYEQYGDKIRRFV